MNVRSSGTFDGGVAQEGEMWRAEFGDFGALYEQRTDAERYLLERRAGRTHDQAVAIVEKNPPLPVDGDPYQYLIWRAP